MPTTTTERASLRLRTFPGADVMVQQAALSMQAPRAPAPTLRLALYRHPF